MKSLWSDVAAAEMVANYADRGVSSALALRVYTSRLLGQETRLVLHGGGNTSVKMLAQDIMGDSVRVLCVKGSGWDMAAIEPQGLPAVRLEPLLRLRSRESLSDEDMVNVQRTNLLDAGSPNPSVETLLHAFLPHVFIDHTHAVSVLSLTDQPNGEDICREVYGDRVAFVPYIQPGFSLACRAADIYDVNPNVEGLILLKHGIFTFGETAREAYERMIDLVSVAEKRLTYNRKTYVAARVTAPMATSAEIAPLLRGALAIEEGDARFKRWVLDFRTGPQILDYVNGEEVARYSQAGVATPDHVIRTKGQPLILPTLEDIGSEAWKQSLRGAIDDYIVHYRAYFQRHNAGRASPKKPLDPIPRVLLAPGLGVFGVGASAQDAAIVADVAESAIITISDAEAIGRFESVSEAALFDMEYWSLEQAKLGKSAEKPLARHVVLITGGAGAIGAATAAAFLREGAEVAIVDQDADRVAETARRLGRWVLGIVADVTEPAAVRAAFDQTCRCFGGVDVVVSNAGAAFQGRIGDLSDDVLRRSFELNFFAHQTVSQNAVRVMRLQGTGGALLYNISKQAVNPGPDFGAYGSAKAAALFLVRQYALDYGREGIRANAVNADRIRSGLLTEAMIAERSRARGVGVKEYMSGNLLNVEVTAEDVAQAFVHQALALKTTASVTTVDGGNIAAALR
ncbi:Bifunctional aldolase/short-chain dehydrogenase [Azospirillaceae bacterium]